MYSNARSIFSQLQEQEQRDKLAKQEMLRRAQLEEQQQQVFLLDQRNQSRQSLAVTVNSQLEADMASTIRSGLRRSLFFHSSNCG